MSSLPGNWRDIRKQVLLLDGYTCRWCIRPAEYVTRWNPAGPYQINNLISLCPGDKVHNDYQVKAAADFPTIRAERSRPVERPDAFVVNPPGT